MFGIFLPEQVCNLLRNVLCLKYQKIHGSVLSNLKTHNEHTKNQKSQRFNFNRIKKAIVAPI